MKNRPLCSACLIFFLFICILIYGGSGLSGTVSSIKELEPDANVLGGLHIGSSSASEPDSAVSEWLSSLGLAE